MDEGLTSPNNRTQIIPKTHDIHLDMAGDPQEMDTAGGERGGNGGGGASGTDGVAGLKVRGADSASSLPMGTEGPESLSSNPIGDFLAGSEVGKAVL